MYLLLAAAMGGIGLLTLPGGWVMVAMSVVFIVGAIFAYSASKKLKQVT
jgi:hypothetical protein